jgi:glycosyltransferase involved in cell wall biosynthesis
MLSAALAEVDGVKVSILRTEAATPKAEEFLEFQRTLGGGVLVFHASHRTDQIWGPVTTRISNITSILKKAELPVVMNLHDVYGVDVLARVTSKLRRIASSGRWRRTDENQQQSAPELPHQPSGFLTRIRSYEENFIRAVDPFVTRYVISNQIEKVRLQKFVSKDKVSVLPHFIERRAICDTPEQAKSKLGLTGRKVVTLLGFIVPRKGYAQAIELLEHLPSDAKVIFAGRGEHGYVQKLTSLAAAKGVADRVRVTGYLSETELNTYLAATDVAICPFQDVSASGSVSTWLSARKPLVTFDLPLMRTYRESFPEHVYLAPKNDMDAFAATVNAIMARPPALGDGGIESFSLENTALKFKGILDTLERQK